MLTRRAFLAVASAAACMNVAGAATAPSTPRRFFRLESRHGRHWLITPEGKPFFSLGLNHLDSSPLRLPEANDAWRKKYGNSTERWLKQAVRPDMLEWGFNTLGWNQEVIVRTDSMIRHSPSFTFEEYQWLDLPYGHLLPFAETHQWDAETKYPDFFSNTFEEWCDYIARSQRARFADDPKLIGYFYTDCPTRVHTRPVNRWKGRI